MWMLSFIPDSWLQFAVFAVLAFGVGMYVLSFFLNFIPPLKPYRLPLQLVGTLLAVCGVYFYGGYSTEMEWRTKVQEAEAKVAKAEADSKEANIQIKTVYVDRVKVVKEKQVVIEKQIVEVAAKMDAKCVVIPEALDILNDAAAGVKK
jgi:apolipoprotein N-acyltransferase